MNSLLEDPTLYSKKPWLQQFATNMACGSTGAQNANWPQVESILTDQLTAAIYGKVTPQQALDNAASKAAPILGTGGTPSPSG